MSLVQAPFLLTTDAKSRIIQVIATSPRRSTAQLVGWRLSPVVRSIRLLWGGRARNQREETHAPFLCDVQGEASIQKDAQISHSAQVSAWLSLPHTVAGMPTLATDVCPDPSVANDRLATRTFALHVHCLRVAAMGLVWMWTMALAKQGLQMAPGEIKPCSSRAFVRHAHCCSGLAVCPPPPSGGHVAWCAPGPRCVP